MRVVASERIARRPVDRALALRGALFLRAAASAAGDCRIKASVSRHGTFIYPVPAGAS